MKQYYTAKILEMEDSLQLKTSVQYSQDSYSHVPKSTNFSQKQSRFMMETNCDNKMKPMVDKCISEYIFQSQTECASSTDKTKCLSDKKTLIETRCKENATPPSVFSKGSLNKYGFICSKTSSDEYDCEVLSCSPESFSDGSCIPYSLQGCKKCQTECYRPSTPPSSSTSTSTPTSTSSSTPTSTSTSSSTPPSSSTSTSSSRSTSTPTSTSSSTSTPTSITDNSETETSNLIYYIIGIIGLLLIALLIFMTVKNSSAPPITAYPVHTPPITAYPVHASPITAYPVQRL
jgi:hypothetical protein